MHSLSLPLRYFLLCLSLIGLLDLERPEAAPRRANPPFPLRLAPSPALSAGVKMDVTQVLLSRHEPY